MESAVSLLYLKCSIYFENYSFSRLGWLPWDLGLENSILHTDTQSARISLCIKVSAGTLSLNLYEKSHIYRLSGQEPSKTPDLVACGLCSFIMSKQDVSNNQIECCEPFFSVSQWVPTLDWSFLALWKCTLPAFKRTFSYRGIILIFSTVHIFNRLWLCCYYPLSVHCHWVSPNRYVYVNLFKYSDFFELGQAWAHIPPTLLDLSFRSSVLCCTFLLW